MKKKFKKLGALLLAGTMAASLMVGCGPAAGGAAPTTSDGAASGDAAPAASGDNITIGVSIWSSTDVPHPQKQPLRRRRPPRLLSKTAT